MNLQLFSDGVIDFAGQPIGIICADTHALANEAVKKVQVTYSGTSKVKPIITSQDGIDSGDKERIQEVINIPAEEQGCLS